MMPRALPLVLVFALVCACGSSGDQTGGAGPDAGGSPPGDAATAVDGALPPGVDGAVPPPGVDSGPGGATAAWSMGYYAGYETSLYPVTSIDWSGLTHIAVAFYLPHTDGSIDETLFM